MELDIKDVDIQRVDVKVKGLRGVSLTAVKLVHKPTGLYSYCACNESYSANFDTAWDCLFGQVRQVEKLKAKLASKEVSEPKLVLEEDSHEEDSQSENR